MGGRGGAGDSVRGWGHTFLPNLKKGGGSRFFPDSQRHAISVLLRRLTMVLDKSCSKVLFLNK